MRDRGLFASHSKTILITGASRGIGQAIALGLLDDGHHIVATARSIAGLKELKEVAERKGTLDRLLCLEMDVCDQSSVDRACDQAESHWEQVDVIINNAGVACLTKALYILDTSMFFIQQP